MIDLLSMDTYEKLDGQTAALLTSAANSVDDNESFDDLINRLCNQGHTLRLQDNGWVHELDANGNHVHGFTYRAKRVFKLFKRESNSYVMDFDSLEMIIDALGGDGDDIRAYDIYMECLHHYDEEMMY